MKGLISGIKRMEIHDGAGLRTTVFFKGCPLHCVWCHNPESISFKPQIAYFSEKCMACEKCISVCDKLALRRENNRLSIDYEKCSLCGECSKHCPMDALFLFGVEYEANELVEILLQDKPFFDNSGGGVTLSGGECLMQAEFAIEVAKMLKENSINVNIDTCGFVDQTVIKRILPYVDTFLYDVKAIDASLHKKCTGQDNALILDNLTFLSKCNAKLEIRIPLVVGINDGEIKKIGVFLSKLKNPPPVRILKYHDFAGSRYKALSMLNTLPKNKTNGLDVQKAVLALRECGITVLNEEE